jgi:hypothetical protein
MAADAAFLLPAGNYGGLRRRLDLMERILILKLTGRKQKQIK